MNDDLGSWTIRTVDSIADALRLAFADALDARKGWITVHLLCWRHDADDLSMLSVVTNAAIDSPDDALAAARALATGGTLACIWSVPGIEPQTAGTWVEVELLGLRRRAFVARPDPTCSGACVFVEGETSPMDPFVYTALPGNLIAYADRFADEEDSFPASSEELARARRIVARSEAMWFILADLRLRPD